MSILYSQTTGRLSIDGSYVGTGYSGQREGLNNSKMEMVHSVGPIPKGIWKIGLWFNDKHLGPCVAALKPSNNQPVFGRGGFFIHGDNKLMNHSASEGCIILSRNLREQIKESRETILEVVE